MAKKYDQYCPMAHALDMVGDRWELLIVRELLHGPEALHRPRRGAAGHRHEHPRGAPARPRDLRRHCEEDAAAARRVTRLRAHGLRPRAEAVLRELALWGARSLGPPTSDDEFFPAGSSIRSTRSWRRSRRPGASSSASATRSPPSSTASRRAGPRTSRTSSSPAMPEASTTSSSIAGSTSSTSRATVSCCRS